MRLRVFAEECAKTCPRHRPRARARIGSGVRLSASVEEDDEGGPVLAYWDCEGFGGSSGDQGRDAHVLALLALLSSALLVNTTGGALDDAALAGLAGACRFGESIEERGNESSRPLLLWVLRDVARQLQETVGGGGGPPAAFVRRWASRRPDSPIGRVSSGVPPSGCPFGASPRWPLLARPSSQLAWQRLAPAPARCFR